MNERSYYVSPRGRDDWTGRLPCPLPDGSDGPWATLARARDALRSVPRDRPIRVRLRGGRHELREPLRFGPEDGGVAGAPVTYAAFPGERAVISGGRECRGWVADRVHDRPCWRLDLPDVASGDWTFTQLFIDGVRRPRARFPKQGYYHFESVPGGRRAYTWYHGVQSLHYRPGELQRWRHLEDVEIKVLTAWYDQHLRIGELDEEARLVTFVCPSLADLYDERGDCARYTVENVFEALSEPGEWYLDRAAGRLYYLPMPGETPETVTAIAPRLESLVQFAGTAERPVTHLRFEQLDFAHTEWRLPPENPGAVQAAFVVPGAIRLRGAHDCAFLGCTVAHAATYGIEIQLGSTRNRILGCIFHDLGAGGVRINHERGLAVRASEDAAFAGLDVQALGLVPEAGEADLPAARTEVADCRLFNNGKIFNGAVGIWVGDSGYNHIHHNAIHDQDYTGISCGWSWSYAPTRTVGNRIEFNHVYNIGRGVLSDMGAIYLLGAQPGGVVRGNHVHHVSCYGYGGSGIYPDQGSSCLCIEDNVVHDTQSDALSIHYGSGLTVRNNIFAHTGSGLMARGREECIWLGTFERNLCLGRTPKMLGYNWNHLDTVGLDRNLYWSGDGREAVFAGLTFEEWQAQGMDPHGIQADPLFRAPEDGDFSLRPDSPALALGFVPWALREAGPRHGGWSSATRALEHPAAADARVILEPRLELGEPTLPTAADCERLTTMPSCLYAPAGEPQLLSLTVTHRGGLPAKGTIAFEVAPAGAATLEGATSVEYALSPGERATFSVRVSLLPDAERVLVRAREAQGQFPMMGLCLTRQRDLAISRLPPVAEAADVAAALRGEPAHAMCVRGQEVGRVRMAIAGDALIISVEACEQVLRVNPEMPWMGSGIECFCESAEAPTRVQQYHLFPAAGAFAAGARRTNHHAATIEEAPGIAVVSAITSAGYRLDARLPLDVLFLSADVPTFRFELALNVTPRAGGPAVNAKLFGGVFSWMGMDGWGTVTVGVPTDALQERA